MSAVLKTRSISASRAAAPSKKHKMSARVTIDIADDDHDEVVVLAVTPTRGYTDCLFILTNTWVVAGCYEVTIKDETRLYCSWQETNEYYRKFEEKSYKMLLSYTDESVCEWLVKTEERFRTVAIGMVRDSDLVPWGMAITHAIKHENQLWTEDSELLVPKSRAQPQQPHALATGEPGGGLLALDDVARKVKNQREPSQKLKVATATETKAGRGICKPWNDQRGCSQRSCPKGFAHCCDVLLDNGKVCESSSHTRSKHDAQKHGKPRLLQ